MIESHDDLPGPEIWLLAPRASSPLTESVYSLASALHTVSLQQLAQVASTRYTVEQGIEKAKVDAGFECYEVQMWAKCCRIITLTMLACAWLG